MVYKAKKRPIPGAFSSSKSALKFSLLCVIICKPVQ